MQGTHAHGAVFKMSHAHGLRLVSADMSATNWHGADIQHAQIDAVQWADAVLREMQGDGSQWNHCACPRANLRGTSLQHSQWKHSSLAEADLRELRAASATFEDVDVRDAECRGADFSHATFLRTDVAHARELAPEWHALARGSLEAALENERSELRREKESAERLRLELESERQQMRALQQQTDERTVQMRTKEDALEAREAHVLMAWAACKRYSKPLMLVAALWCVISSMILTVILYQISMLGPQNLKMLEVGVVAFAVLVLLAMHCVSAMLVFKAGRAMDAGQEHRDSAG